MGSRAEQVPTWRDIIDATRKYVEEESAPLRALVEDPDSLCPMREIRRERIRTLEQVASLMDTLETWEW